MTPCKTLTSGINTTTICHAGTHQTPMADSLIEALKRVHISSSDALADDWIDGILDSTRPRKRIKQSPEALKASLEQKYLTPSTSFSTEWLNKLQQYILPSWYLCFLRNETDGSGKQTLGYPHRLHFPLQNRPNSNTDHNPLHP